MKVNEIIDFLLMIVDKELEEEYETTNDKEWIANYIAAENWLMKKQGTLAIVRNAIIEEDIEKYLKEDK